jgi:hypothetical protein
MFCFPHEGARFSPNVGGCWNRSNEEGEEVVEGLREACDLCRIEENEYLEDIDSRDSDGRVDVHCLAN